MTKKTIISHVTFLSMAVMLTMAGAMTVQASEVTGTLSSNASADSQTSGKVEGTVSDDSQTDGTLGGTVTSDSTTDGSLEGTVSNGSGRSGGSSSGGSRSSATRVTTSDEPAGAVLGAASDNTLTPRFPNAGTPPLVSSVDQPLWSTVMNLFKNMFAF